MQEFSPGSNGRMTTMGVYVRDLILGQVCISSSCFQNKNKCTCLSDIFFAGYVVITEECLFLSLLAHLPVANPF